MRGLFVVVGSLLGIGSMVVGMYAGLSHEYAKGAYFTALAILNFNLVQECKKDIDNGKN